MGSPASQHSTEQAGGPRRARATLTWKTLQETPGQARRHSEQTTHQQALYFPKNQENCTASGGRLPALFRQE